jgi:hypothetical protein
VEDLTDVDPYQTIPLVKKLLSGAEAKRATANAILLRWSPERFRNAYISVGESFAEISTSQRTRECVQQLRQEAALRYIAGLMDAY